MSRTFKYSRSLALAIVVVECALIMLCSSCSPGRHSPSTKLESDIKRIEYDLTNTTNVALLRLYADELSALKLSDQNSLVEPRIAAAVFGTGKIGENYSLLVDWIEQSPTIDGFEFGYGSSSPTITNLLSETSRMDYQETGTNSILFSMAYTWKEGTPQSENFRAITVPGNIKVRLLRSGTAVTPWYPVPYFRQGHLITSTN